MARKQTHIPLNIFINGHLVGQLKKERTGAIYFQYDESWLKWKHTFPISLSLPLREDKYTGNRVLAVFDNLLPDNETIRRRIAERTNAIGYDTYSLLAKIGRDCIGALQLLPEGEKTGCNNKIDGEPINNKNIARILSDLHNAPLGITKDNEFRISIAGAQEKTALLLWNGHWYKPRGTTATTHILKPNIGKRLDGIDLSQSVANEHFCMLITKELGLPAANTEIHEFDGKQVLIIERFDRRFTGTNKLIRLPQEDCCQALSIPPTLKYESDGGPGIPQILEFLKGSDYFEDDRKMFIKAQIIFWLLGATDGHAKNFSVFLYPGGRFKLTPLYDIMSTQPNIDAHQIPRKKMRLAMCIGEKRHYTIDSILPRHFIQTAKKSGLADNVLPDIFHELLIKMPKAIKQAQSQLPQNFPGKLINSICKGISARLQYLNNISNS